MGLATGKRPGVTAVRKPAVTPPQRLSPILHPTYKTTTYDSAAHTVNDITSPPMPTLPPSPSRTRKTHENPKEPNNMPQNDGDVATPNNEITDVYMVDELGKPIVARASNPFLTAPSLQGPRGERVRFLAIVDNGAMINAIDATAYQRTARRLNPLSPSSRKLRMANGSVISSTGTWAGTLEWGPITTHTTFEVFPSGGSWQMLIGKPLLEQVKATQDYSTDSISIPTNTTHHRIHNFVPHHTLPLPFLPSAISSPAHVHPPTPPTPPPSNEHVSVHQLTTTQPRSPAPTQTPGNVPPPPPIPDNNIFTRLTEKGPFHPPRMDAILNAVHIGNITPEESEMVRNLLREFADVFALSVKEVKPLPSIKYRLNIPEGATFSVKANQRPLNQAQKAFYFPKLEEFVSAGVLRPIHASQVKAVHPTVLAQKAHESPGLTMDEIRQEVNEQCILLGEPPNPNTPRRTIPPPQTKQTHQTEPKRPKWRITQNFSQLSRICQSAQVPQGDL